MKAQYTSSYPGSRWWKFDFHTHTPESKDTGPWQKAIGTSNEVTPEKWLLKYMAAKIDCVAITDHNSGAWIDKLKNAYSLMKHQADAGNPTEGFREITLFPGVEISAHGGVHVLAIFDPTATTSQIDSLLGAVGFSSQLRGVTDSENEAAVTKSSLTEVIETVLREGGIPIPAHADANSGLLRVEPGTRKSVLQANTVKQVLEVEGLLAVEWVDLKKPYPQSVEKHAQSLARVLGSDCHNFQSTNTPGSRFTWVKMASPTLEGLRLALLDGNSVSIRRSDDPTAFDPFKTPAQMIRAIEIQQSRVMGNGQPAQLELSPYFNGIVGGRGTGKSTVVHALRLAARREDEIQRLPEDSEPREQFEAFRQVISGRYSKGALKPETVVRVEWQSENARLRLCWQDEGKTLDVEEWRDDQWQRSPSQSINHNRFPIRIFSQGQIAAMAGKGRQTLLAIIDEAAGGEPLQQAFEEAQRTYFTQRARLRELDGKLTTQPEVERRLQEIEVKLEALSQTDHSTVLQAFARAQHQQRVVEETFAQLNQSVVLLREAAERLFVDESLPQNLTDDDLLAWKSETDRLIAEARQQLKQQAATLEQDIATLTTNPRLAVWRARANAAHEKNEKLQADLAAQGVADPHAFTRLTEEHQQLDAQLKDLRQWQTNRTDLHEQIAAQEALLLERRQAITHKRQVFLREKLAHNPYVRINVTPFGFDPMVIERSLRELIDVPDERFQDDILKIKDGEAKGGLAFELATADFNNKISTLNHKKKILLERLDALGGHFRNYMEKKLQKPEFSDHILAWFPEDDLRIEYQRENRWYAISEGSQGQRSAALLSFLLAFGEEPIVLDQPEDDLDNQLIYDLIVRQIRENKLRRQLIVVTHNPNVVVNGDAELVHVMAFSGGQCRVSQSGALQEQAVREEVCQVMEGGREAFSRRWKRLGKKV